MDKISLLRMKLRKVEDRYEAQNVFWRKRAFILKKAVICVLCAKIISKALYITENVAHE